MEAIINDIKSKPLEDSIKGMDIEETVDPLDGLFRFPLFTDIVFNIHNGSLLIDDIQDKSILRRGVPATHTIFGIGNTVISATFLMSKNMDLAMDLNHPEAVRESQDSLLRTLAGQGMEIYWRDNFICPTEEEYLQMVSRKTAGFFHYSNNLMQLFATKKKNPSKFLTCLGMYFQINDDYQNLNSEVYFKSKGFCEDLTEGKFGFPIVHAINTCPKEGKFIMETIRGRPTDMAEKEQCRYLIESCGSFEYTRNKITELRRIISEEIDKLAANPLMDTYENMKGHSILFKKDPLVTSR